MNEPKNASETPVPDNRHNLELELAVNRVVAAAESFDNWLEKLRHLSRSSRTPSFSIKLWLQSINQSVPDRFGIWRMKQRTAWRNGCVNRQYPRVNTGNA